MILSDKDILKEVEDKRIEIVPFDANRIQPASYDISLGNRFRRFNLVPSIDLAEDLGSVTGGEIVADSFEIWPQELILSSTKEWIRVPSDLVAQLEGKSSLARIGLGIHVTAGYIDPGFQGEIVLEMVNFTRSPIVIYAGMPVGQLCFHQLTSPATRIYGSKAVGSHYQGQRGPVASRYRFNR